MVAPGNVIVVKPQRFNQFGKHIMTSGIRVKPDEVAVSGVSEDDLAACDGEQTGGGIENHLNVMLNDDTIDDDLLEAAVEEFISTDDGWTPLPSYEEGSW